MRVLLVEDDREIARRLGEGLADAGFSVEYAYTGPDGLAFGMHDAFDAVILDLGLPHIQGVDVLKSWRKEKRDFPVLILTARGTWSEKVDGLNARGCRAHQCVDPAFSRLGLFGPPAR